MNVQGIIRFAMCCALLLGSLVSLASEPTHRLDLEACHDISTLNILINLSERMENSSVQELTTLICSLRSVPAGTIKYPNGNIAFVGTGYSDSGSWKYSNGNYAYVGGNYSDKGSWKYPNGNYAFVGGNYSDQGSWKYPNGNYAFVGGNYSDKGSWKYPNGNYAFIGGNYSYEGSWKYPNGNYAYVSGNYSDKDSWKYPNGNDAYVGGNYSDKGTWKYPNGNVHSTNSVSEDGDQVMVGIIENYFDVRFCGSFSDQSPINTLFRLTWIQEQFDRH